VIVFDTTVLLDAVGIEHRFREPCRALIDAIQSGHLEATTTVEAIQDFAHVRARRRDRNDSAELAHAYLDLLSPLLLVEEPHLREGLRLFAADQRLGSFDAVLAAAAASVGAVLVSADAAFASVPAITHVTPDDNGVRHLLASHRRSDP
jgi:uncharacterized protein